MNKLAKTLSRMRTATPPFHHIKHDNHLLLHRWKICHREQMICQIKLELEGDLYQAVDSFIVIIFKDTLKKALMINLSLVGYHYNGVANMDTRNLPKE